MLKIVSENFIHAFLLFLGLFLKISRWVPLHWTNFAICTTVVRVMVAYIVFELLFIAPGYQIYIN